MSKRPKLAFALGGSKQVSNKLRCLQSSTCVGLVRASSRDRACPDSSQIVI